MSHAAVDTYTLRICKSQSSNQPFLTRVMPSDGEKHRFARARAPYITLIDPIDRSLIGNCRSAIMQTRTVYVRCREEMKSRPKSYTTMYVGGFQISSILFNLSIQFDLIFMRDSRVRAMDLYRKLPKNVSSYILQRNFCIISANKIRMNDSC